MTIARRELVPENQTGIYHCTARCVRRAFLCGQDDYSGNNYDHRRQWVVDRLAHLIKVFSIEVLSYAAMSNHLHLVVRTRPEQADAWTDEEVADRWLALYPPRHGGINGTAVPYGATQGEKNLILRDKSQVLKLRSRLSRLSWFMKSLNEHIARRANREDGCKGRFWEGRFHCQRLLSESAILACMCYVDLNPIRARMASSIEDSHFTSAFDRIARQREIIIFGPDMPKQAPIEPSRIPLVDLDGPKSPFTYWGERDYLHILDATGRELSKDKPGYIAEDVRPLLESLALDADHWLQTVEAYRKHFGLVAGTMADLRQAACDLGQRWLKGCRAATGIFRSSDACTRPI